MTKAEQPTITQADVEAAEREAEGIYLANSDVLSERDREIIKTNLSQAFAKHRTTYAAAQDGLVDALRVIAVGEGCMNGIREELSAAALRKIARAALASIEVKSS